MAIDADMSAGLIDEKTARRRRRDLEEESSFYGAMDGAAKFVRGDAIAGLIITGINIIGGLAIGLISHHMAFADAVATFTTLSAGDGLVAQIPALLVSTAAGIVVTKGSTEGTADVALVSQLGRGPKPLAMAAGAATVLGLLPGLPTLPFLAIAGLAGGAAWLRLQHPIGAIPVGRGGRNAGRDRAADHRIVADGHDPAGAWLRAAGTRRRRRPATDGADQKPAAHHCRRYGVCFAAGTDPGQHAARPSGICDQREGNRGGTGGIAAADAADHGPQGAALPPLAGEGRCGEPDFGLPAMWIDPSQREEALFRGCTVVDAPTVLSTHLTEIVRQNVAELLSYAETRKLLDELPTEHQKLVSDMIPATISVGAVQRVLQSLLEERVSIRDLPTILEGIQEACGAPSRAIPAIVSHVRARLARQISDQHTGTAGYIPLLTLSPDWEAAFAESLSGPPEERQLAMAPGKLQEFVRKLNEVYERASSGGELPVVLSSGAIRAHVRAIVERVKPGTAVLSQLEIFPRAKIRTVGTV